MSKFDRRLQAAKERVSFCCALYRHQLREGRHFLHEHPWSAKSWKLEYIDELLKDSRVVLAKTDMCRFGMRRSNNCVRAPRVLACLSLGICSWCPYKSNSLLNRQEQYAGNSNKQCHIYIYIYIYMYICIYGSVRLTLYLELFTNPFVYTVVEKIGLI